jgi:hypothetical protein
MTNSPLPRRRLLQLCAASAVLVAGAVILGWHAGEPATATAPAPVPAPWALPQINLSDPARDVASLTARHPWGGGAGFHDIDSPQRTPAPAGAPWHLAGIIERGGERFALILVGQGPAAKLEYRAKGDLLPDGNVLVQIGADSATSEAGKAAAAERRVYRLFERAN